jgi:hypothetical protein
MTTTAKLSANTLDVVPDVEATVEAVYPAPILIAEHEVAFATAAAVPVPRPTTRWWTKAINTVSAAASGILRTSTADSRPARRNYPRHYTFLENARMSREMDRL